MSWFSDMFGSDNQFDIDQLRSLMELDVDMNRFDQGGLFSSWNWNDDKSGIQHTANPGMQGAMDRLQGNANKQADPYRSPEQFSGMLDALMGNFLDRTGMDWQGFTGDEGYGPSSGDREGMFGSNPDFNSSSGGGTGDDGFVPPDQQEGGTEDPYPDQGGGGNVGDGSGGNEGDPTQPGAGDQSGVGGGDPGQSGSSNNNWYNDWRNFQQMGGTGGSGSDFAGLGGGIGNWMRENALGGAFSGESSWEELLAGALGGATGIPFGSRMGRAAYNKWFNKDSNDPDAGGFVGPPESAAGQQPNDPNQRYRTGSQYGMNNQYGSPGSLIPLGGIQPWDFDWQQGNMMPLGK